MAVKPGEWSDRTENCLTPRSGGVFSVQRNEPKFYQYFSIVLTFSFVISFGSSQKK
jgi:hypothetical protein